jgi:hypothetical protein
MNFTPSQSTELKKGKSLELCLNQELFEIINRLKTLSHANIIKFESNLKHAFKIKKKNFIMKYCNISYNENFKLQKLTFYSIFKNGNLFTFLKRVIYLIENSSEFFTKNKNENLKILKLFFKWS